MIFVFASMFEYSSTTNTKAAFSGDSTILTNTGYVPLKSIHGKLVRGYNGGEWSYTHVLKNRFPQPLFHVVLSDGRTIDCSQDTQFFVDDNFNSMSLYEILKHYRQTLETKPEIYTNKITSEHSYEYQKLIEYSELSSSAVDTYYPTTIDSAHRAFINNILLRCW